MEQLIEQLIEHPIVTCIILSVAVFTYTSIFSIKGNQGGGGGGQG
jgi:hypothetical protein